MTSIIKNQLIKHLSKFTKNLKPEQISLDVLKGNSKLQFIEINEEVLTEILELPGWLRIKRASCTGVAINVPWTKLKSTPVQIFIDEINVDVELTSEKTTTAKLNSLGSMADVTSYGFINKIVENLSLYINTVEINFDSEVFGGSFMLQRLSLESRSPSWATVKDLRQTRISCSISNRSLMFKQLSWHLLRIEASAKTSKTEQRTKINAPLRLITSGGKIRIALKKNSTDGTVIHAQIQTVLEDILWVATLPQLRSAISFGSYIANLAQESRRNCNEMTGTSTRTSSAKNQDIVVKEKKGNLSVFEHFCFDQTSYHLHVKKIDLHLCDDAHAASDYPPNWNIDSGAMQITLIQVQIDIYPEAQAASDRATWMKYHNSDFLLSWINNHLLEQFCQLKNNSDKSMNGRLERCWPQLVAFFFVLRIYDLNIQCVSDMNTKKDALTNIFQSERHNRCIPAEQRIVHVEFAVFSHPLTNSLPVPKPTVFIQLGPFTFTFDERTVRWCFYVAHTLQSAIDDGNLTMQSTTEFQEPVFEFNLVMPKIILNFPIGMFPECPRRLVVSMSTFTISSSSKEKNYFQKFETFDRLNDESNQMLKKIIHRFCPQSTNYTIYSSPLWIETDHGVYTKGIPLLHDVPLMGIIFHTQGIANVIIEPTEDVVLLLDHFQLQQLVSLNEQFEVFSNTLSADMKHYSTQKPITNNQFDLFVDINKIRCHLILTAGDIPTPYNLRTFSSKLSSTFMDKISEMGSSNSMNQSTDSKLCPRTQTLAQPQSSSGYDNFPEFPVAQNEIDMSPLQDENLSIATSLDDEAGFEYEDIPNDDPFGIPEMAEEAITIDEIPTNDSVFRKLMSKNVNILILCIDRLQLSGSFFANNIQLEGQLKQILIEERLSIIRGELEELIKKESHEKIENNQKLPWEVTFNFNSPDCGLSHLQVNVEQLSVELDDETITHFLAFLKIDQMLENQTRIAVHVQNSIVEIRDRKKSKPMRLKIKHLHIEQEDD